MTTLPEKLIPFLCYAKENVEIVRQLAARLKAEGWIDPWFDEEDILPGQKWEDRVVQAVHEFACGYRLSFQDCRGKRRIFSQRAYSGLGYRRRKA